MRRYEEGLMSKKVLPIIYALLAAVFYGINVPFSKMLFPYISPTLLAGLLYLGAGTGVGILRLFSGKKGREEDKLAKEDLPYVVGMILLDIAAPILLMLGIRYGSSAGASLLGNFEIVATSLVALVIFKEKITKRLWIAISLITTASILLSYQKTTGLDITYGSLFVILATICWGFENNCTRKIAEKSTYQIVIIKGLFSGGGALTIGLFLGETIPKLPYLLSAMLLGFASYGLSIFVYIRAQRDLGAAKTSAYYATAPFLGSFLSFVLLGEKLSAAYSVALVVMIVGTVFVILDTLMKSHSHLHEHRILHTHGGITHIHVIRHEHVHTHIKTEAQHAHYHRRRTMEHDPHHK